MTASDETSADKLDDLLREGKISRDEYQNLHAALAAGPLPATGPASGPPEPSAYAERPRLCKSWKNRILGGVCAGIAEHFNVDPWIIRIIFIIGLLVSGGAAILVYLILYFALPWSGPRVASIHDIGIVPWWFVANITAAWALLIFIYGFVFQYFITMYRSLGAEMPFWSKMAWHLARPFAQMPEGALWQLLLACAIVAIYWTMPRQSSGRRIYCWMLGIAYMILILSYLILPIICLRWR